MISNYKYMSVLSYQVYRFCMSWRLIINSSELHHIATSHNNEYTTFQITQFTSWKMKKNSWNLSVVISTYSKSCWSSELITACVVVNPYVIYHLIYLLSCILSCIAYTHTMYICTHSCMAVCHHYDNARVATFIPINAPLSCKIWHDTNVELNDVSIFF